MSPRVQPAADDRMTFTIGGVVCVPGTSCRSSLSTDRGRSVTGYRDKDTSELALRLRAIRVAMLRISRRATAADTRTPGS